MLFSELKQHKNSQFEPTGNSTMISGIEKSGKLLNFNTIDTISGWQGMEIESQASAETILIECEQRDNDNMCYVKDSMSESWSQQNLGGNYERYDAQDAENPELCMRSGRRKNSLIQRWKKDDPIFQGKFSTGATPKIEKKDALHPLLSNLSLNRANSDIPPTLENGLRAFQAKDSYCGSNKYVKNPRNLTEPLNVGASHPVTNQSILDTKIINCGLEKINQVICSPVVSKPQFNEIISKNNSATAFSRKLFMDDDDFEEKEGSYEKPKGLFIISETQQNNEVDMEKSSSTLNSKPHSEVGNLLSNQNWTKMGTPEQERQIGNTFQRKLFDTSITSTPTKLETENIRYTSQEDSYIDSRIAKKIFKSEAEASTFTFLDRIEEQANLDASGFSNSKATFKKQGQDMNAILFPNSRFLTDYETLEVIGSGHFGKVYKCLNKIDGLIYAIKAIRYKKKGVSHIDQAISEIQALASLSMIDENQNIVRYHNVWMEDEMIFLAMEYCPSNLRNIELKQTKFSESMIRQVLRDTCMGLKHLHQRKIVHLDIKPENILYSRTKKYKISDLGLSRIAERQAGEDINEGDSRYMAPELLDDLSESLPDLTKADIFSLGMTIYELMSGQSIAKSNPEFRALRTGNFLALERLKNFSNSLKSIVKLMLSPNPDNRPSAQDLLEKWLQSQPELELQALKDENEKLRKELKGFEQRLGIRRKISN